MGLSISRPLCKIMAGGVATTNEGPGATFQFTFSKHH